MGKKEFRKGTGFSTKHDPARRRGDVPLDLGCLLLIMKAAPDAYLILSPELEIQLVTDTYLAAVQRKREDLLGRYLFDAFPDNPDTPEGNAVENLQLSFHKVLETGKPHLMAIQQYVLPMLSENGGGLAKKHWSSLNTPVLNDAGEVAYIIHKIMDVAEFTNSQQNPTYDASEQHLLQAALHQLQLTQQKLEAEQRRHEDTQTLGHIGSFEAVFPDENIRWSDELYRIYGLEPQSIAIDYDMFFAFIHPDDKDKYEKAFQVFFMERKDFDLINRIIRKDGTVRVVHTRAEVVRDAAGKELKVHGTVLDITEQVKAREKLHESETLLREAEQAGHIGSYYGDVASLTFQFSDGMFSLIGYPPDSFIPTLDLIDEASHPDDIQEVRDILEQAARDKQPYEYTRRIYRPDGQMRYLHSRGKVICDSEGHAIKFIGTVQDITERKEAEEKLRQSELHFRTLIENTPDIISRWDKDLKLIFHNQTSGTPNSFPVSLLYPDKEPESEQPDGNLLSWKEAVRLAFLTGEVQDYYSSYPLQVDTISFHSRLVPEFAVDGTVQSVLVIARDITARKRLEQENLRLKLSQQKELLLAIMETQETERRRIAESLHNGLSQLLYGAKLNLDQLTQDEVNQDEEKHRVTVRKTENILEEAINQARNLSHQLTPSVLEHFGLEAALKEVCAMFGSKGLDFQCMVFNLQSKIEKHLQVAVYRIAQELANNIVKHADATEACLLLREQKGALVLLSEDNGKGFDPERVQSKGIGIKSIQDRVALLNGTMRIVSAPSQGTLVQINLPLTT